MRRLERRNLLPTLGLMTDSAFVRQFDRYTLRPSRRRSHADCLGVGKCHAGQQRRNHPRLVVPPVLPQSLQTGPAGKDPIRRAVCLSARLRRMSLSGRHRFAGPVRFNLQGFDSNRLQVDDGLVDRLTE